MSVHSNLEMEMSANWLLRLNIQVTQTEVGYGTGSRLKNPDKVHGLELLG